MTIGKLSNVGLTRFVYSHGTDDQRGSLARH
jgi:hypothetical protein